MNETNLIADAKVTILNTKTKKISQSVLVNRVPYFGNLEEGKYEITITNPEYKKTKEFIELSCADVDVDNKFCKSVFLHKGSVSETVFARPRGNFIVGEPESGGEGYLPPPPPKRPISKGVINGKAISLPKPPYPAAARAVRASGVVNVQVLIDEEGNVISANALTGHPLLQEAAVKAAREAKFEPMLLEGQPVKVNGIIVFNFIP